MTEPARVLVVDDEPGITDLVAMALRYEGLDVLAAHSGIEALEVVGDYRPQVIVLDVMLPDLDGFEVLRRLPDEGQRVPVIFLTARGELEDKLRGFTLGGDDYITKPFSVEELVVRTRAVLRRGGRVPPASKPLTFADVAMDEDRHMVHRAQHEISLTPTEFKLLHYLLLNAHRVVSKGQILLHVWQHDFGGTENVVEIYISSLRRKLEAHGPRVIQTVRGFGYRLRDPEG
ncbi:MAG TPA: response regulator transcription factor [Acidimicrobiales bacterium]|jgi:two-component system OmpR family response regulator